MVAGGICIAVALVLASPASHPAGGDDGTVAGRRSIQQACLPHVPAAKVDETIPAFNPHELAGSHAASPAVTARVVGPERGVTLPALASSPILFDARAVPSPLHLRR